MARVIRIDNRAWTLESLQSKQRIEAGDLILSWEPGQNSALDSREISEGRDVGNVTVERRTAEGTEDVAYDVTFAFVFHAFYPDGELNR